MAERDARTPEIRVPTLGGLNERPSPANLRPGEFDVLEGLYPANIGLLARVPGKTPLVQVNGKALQIFATYNVFGDVLIQTDQALYSYTLDELRSRSTVPNLTYPDLSEEETMSMALIVQQEANGVPGGSAQGYISGTDSTSAANTFYGRRLTTMLVNESATVASFTASTGGASAASTEGTFTLTPGTYRITINALYGPMQSGISLVAGLYNVTSSAFEVYAGGSVPIVSTPHNTSGGQAGGANNIVHIEAVITVASTNKTYAIRHECTGAADAKATRFCGSPYTANTANVNSAAVLALFCTVKILRTA